MSLSEWAATVGGLLLVAVALREVFHTLLHPSGIGQITPVIFRSVWRLARRLGPSAKRLAGPLAMTASIATWTSMLVLGWALVYWPQLPEQFNVAQGIPKDEQGSILDAIYLSAVTLSTLGYGDIVPEEIILRLALAFEALVGFALLTASITWVLSIYPALMRQRTLAAQIGGLVDGDGRDARLIPGDPPAAIALVLHGLSGQLASTRVDLIQYPSTYFFHGPAVELAPPVQLDRLRHAVERHDIPPEARRAVELVTGSLGDLERTLGDGPFGLPGDDGLAAAAAEHR